MKKESKAVEPRDRGLNKVYQICGVVICLAAIVTFIIWIIDSSKIHMMSQTIMGVGLLTISLGVLMYLLTRRNSYVLANWLLWICILGSIVLFFVGMAKAEDVSEAAAILGAVPPNP